MIETPAAIEVTPRDALSKGAKTVKRMEGDDGFRHFSAGPVLDWIGRQEDDLGRLTPEIRDALREFARRGGDRDLPMRIDERLGALSDRTARLSQMKSDTLDATDLAARIRSLITACRDDLGRQDEASLARLQEAAGEVQELSLRLEDLLGRLLPELASDRTARSVSAAQNGATPVSDALSADLEAIRGAIDELPDMPAAMEPPPAPAAAAPPASAAPGAKPEEEPTAGRGLDNPLIAQRKKDLGRALDTRSVEATARNYFVRLWESGADSGRIGEIMFFVPAAARGIAVYDLLGFSGGEKILMEAVPEIVARFPAPE